GSCFSDSSFSGCHGPARRPVPDYFSPAPTGSFPSTVSRAGCPNQGWGPCAGYFASSTDATSAIVPSAGTHPLNTSGKSTAQFAHFFPLANRIGHQKLSTFRSISDPSDHTPVIQSQYRHQIRS